MGKKYSYNKQHLLMMESIRKSYGEIYGYLMSLKFILELLIIKEGNSENKKLGSLLVFFGASYFKKYIESKNILENKKTMKIFISVLFDVLKADLSDRIIWMIYYKKEFLEIKEEILEFNFEGKEIIESYF